MKAGAGIEHQRGAHRFVLREHAGEACLVYRPLADGSWDFVHTFVPPALRGRGLAGRLVAHAVAHCRQEGMAVRAGCSYVRRWLDAHPGAAPGWPPDSG